MSAIDFSSNSLHVGNLTIKGLNPDDRPALVVGEGLGNALLGRAGSIDRIMRFEAGSGQVISDQREGISISSTKKIKEILIVPSFSILDSSDLTKLPFEIGYFLLGTGSLQAQSYLKLDPNKSNPVAIPLKAGSLPMEIRMEVTSGDPMFLFFNPYLKANNFPALAFQFGFSIKSIKTM